MGIQLDINPEELGRNYPIQLGMQGDVRNSLRTMIRQVETAEPRAQWINRVQELVRNWEDSVSDKVNSDMVPILPERLRRELTDYLPSDAILVSDTGHAGIWTGTMIDLKHPGQIKNKKKKKQKSKLKKKKKKKEKKKKKKKKS